MTAGELVREARLRAGLSQADLARRAGTSQPAVARYESGVTSPSVATLERLLRACGRSLRMSAEDAPASDISGPLARLLRERRGRINEIAKLHGAWNIRIFGSVARGEETAESDVDLLVEIDPGRDLLDLAGLELDLEELLGVHVDVATVSLLKPRIRQRVLADAVPL